MSKDLSEDFEPEPEPDPELSDVSDDSDDYDEPEDPSSEIIQFTDLDDKTVSQHRKAYVKWINEEFYKRLQKLNPESSLNIFQKLVQSYLALNTPYRGLLVYHGLGTGKTATAISLAEGLSGQMRINTLLPASLEANFISEITGEPVTGKMGWGKDELNKDNQWSFISLQDINEEFKDKYKLDGKVLRKIQNATVKEIKKNHNDKSLEKEAKNIRGFFIPDPSGKSLDDLTLVEKEFVNQESNYLIRTKYNFIHYNPFPKVKSSVISEFQNEESDEDEDLRLLDKEEKKIIETHNLRIV